MSKDREREVLNAAVAHGITNPRELANFMAQTTHESMGLNRVEEGFRYTKSISQIPVKYAHRHGDVALESARQEALKGHPEALAELMYGGRMGNDQPGDGFKYHGRGYIQLTGKANYEAAGTDLGIDLVNHPELASKPENATKIALWYWDTRVSEQHRGNVKLATHDINGRENGLADRLKRFDHWQQVLTPEVINNIKAGKLGEPMHARVEYHGAIPSGANNNASTERHALPSKADAVNLQSALNHLGYMGKDSKPLETRSGQFGPDSDHALREFQSAHGLKPDGIVGPKTQEALRHAKDDPLINETGHPSHGMYEQIKEQTDKLGGAKALGFNGEKEYAQALANMTYQAKLSGMTQVDHVVETTNKQNLVMIQGGITDPAQQREVSNKAHAAQVPVAQSTQQLQQDVQQLQQQHHVQAQQQVAQSR